MIHWLPDEFGWLEGHDRDVYSQFGEDGLIAAVFGRVGETNRWAFECGATDGLFYSNTASIDNWHCVLMDRDEKAVSECRKNRPHANTLCGTLGESLTLDFVLEECGAPIDLDLCIIDIDGQDYWIVHDMQRYRPRVLMVEYECPNRESPPPERGKRGKQAGREATMELLRSKGYVPVVCTDCNCIAVRDDLYASMTNRGSCSPAVAV